MRAFRIIIDAAKAYYEEMLFYFMTGAIMFAIAVAAVLLAPFGLVLFILLPFAMTAVWMVAHRAVRGLGVKWRLCWEAVKDYGPRSLLLNVVLLAGYAILLINLWFYNNPDVSPIPMNIARILTPLWIVLTVVWTGITFYAEAFLIELEEPKLLTILRNGLSLIALRLLVTLILLIVTGLLIALSVVIPVLLIALPGFIAVLSITAVRTLIKDIQAQYESKFTNEDADEDVDEEAPETATDSAESDAEAV